MKFQVLFMVVMSFAASQALWADVPVSEAKKAPGCPENIELVKTIQDLRAQVSSLQARLDAVNCGAPVAETPKSVLWTCTAECGGYRDGKLNGFTVTASAESQKEAFEGIESQCFDGSKIFLYIGTAAIGSGQNGLVYASMYNACLSN